MLFDLRQQKLYQLISLSKSRQMIHKSTIVEIILAYQPQLMRSAASNYLRQQKLYQLISPSEPTVTDTYLRQQKLYQLISPMFGMMATTVIYDSRNYISLLAGEICSVGVVIYDSRNYISLLALQVMLHAPLTIYDSRNYISLLAVISLTPQSKDLRQQKLYQLISLFLAFAFLYSYLRQQKLYQLISPIYSPIPPIMIYDSRNYISLLAPCKFNTLISVSTIVEIILAYQPLLFINVGVGYLRQQKLYQLISPFCFAVCHKCCIYDSRNYISLLAHSLCA